MEAEETRRRTDTGAERMRIATESARENARLGAEVEQQRLEEAIVATADTQKSSIDKIIREAANMGKSNVSHTYSERISASHKSHEEVAFTEWFADTVSQRVVTTLQTEGYTVSTQTREVVDFRDNVNSPPEYYDTAITISW